MGFASFRFFALHTPIRHPHFIFQFALPVVRVENALKIHGQNWAGNGVLCTKNNFLAFLGKSDLLPGPDGHVDDLKILSTGTGEPTFFAIGNTW